MPDLINVSVTRSGELEQIFERLSDPRELNVANLAVWRSAIREEFSRGGWLRPQGGFQSWAPTKPFGSRQPPVKTLVRSGRLRRAWLGEGPGGFERLTERGFEFGIRSATIPYAPVHRPPEPSATAFGQVTKIFVRRRQRTFLGLEYGVWLKRSTRFLRVPARPHATANPAVTNKMVENVLKMLNLRPLETSI